MNYYKRHLGDYAKDTRHLSLAEHGAYCLLLDYYYATEKPIPDDRCERIANAYADFERAAVRSVLKEFFTQTPEGWTQRKADEVIKEFSDKSLKAKASADARWHKEESERNANASETKCDGNASHKPLASNQEEATDSQPPAASQAVACPHSEIIALYHEVLPACTRVKVWDDTRSAMLRKRWREDPKRQSLDYWKRLFAHCAKSDFLMGRVADRDGRAFQLSLDWIVRPTNFAKIIEGKYHHAR